MSRVDAVIDDPIPLIASNGIGSEFHVLGLFIRNLYRVPCIVYRKSG